jgi:hypothetical protein
MQRQDVADDARSESDGRGDKRNSDDESGHQLRRRLTTLLPERSALSKELEDELEYEQSENYPSASTPDGIEFRMLRGKREFLPGEPPGLDREVEHLALGLNTKDCENRKRIVGGREPVRALDRRDRDNPAFELKR